MATAEPLIYTNWFRRCLRTCQEHKGRADDHDAYVQCIGGKSNERDGHDELADIRRRATNQGILSNSCIYTACKSHGFEWYIIDRDPRENAPADGFNPPVPSFRALRTRNLSIQFIEPSLLFQHGLEKGLLQLASACLTVQRLLMLFIRLDPNLAPPSPS